MMYSLLTNVRLQNVAFCRAKFSQNVKLTLQKSQIVKVDLQMFQFKKNKNVSISHSKTNTFNKNTQTHIKHII